MRALRASYLLFGVFWGTWAVAAFDVQRFLEFDDGQLGLLLAATVGGGAAANVFGGVVTERLGTSRTLAIALLVWSGLLLITTALEQRALFCIAFTGAIAVGGLVDVAMNIAGAAAFADTPSRLLRLHALFNAGTLAGAGMAGVVLDAGWSFRILWVAVGVVAVAVSAWTRRAELPAGERGEQHSLREGFAALHRAGLLLVAVVFGIGALVEGGVASWGVLFLRSRLGLAALAGAGAYVAGQALATIARATLGATADRLGESRGAQFGLGLAGAGLVLEASSNATIPAAIGLAAAAVGSAVYWPMLVAYASRGRDRPGLVVGGLTASGYIGFLAGPPVVGWVGDAVGLQWGIGALGVISVAGALIPISRSRAPSPAAARR